MTAPVAATGAAAVFAAAPLAAAVVLVAVGAFAAAVGSAVFAGAAFLAAVLVGADEAADASLCVETVSYTHLDVYKRQVLEHLALHAGQLVDDLDHVDGDTDRAGLVGHRPGDGLPDPPRGVGRELVALGVVELLDRTDEAKVAFLDEVEDCLLYTSRCV